MQPGDPPILGTSVPDPPERIFPFVVKMCLWSAVVVFVGFVALVLLVLVLAALSGDDDMPYLAERTDVGAWSLGPSTTVAVDLPLASIRVLASLDDRISASMRVEVITDAPQAKADRKLAAVDSTFRVEGGGLLITTQKPFNLSAGPRFDLTLRVPAGVSLNLRTADGPVTVGELMRPVVARSILVRNDSFIRSNMNGGNPSIGDVWIECRACSQPGQPHTPVALDVEAPGSIRIDADLATVRALARHGEPPSYWGPDGIKSYEDGVEGSVRFRGTFFGEANKINAAHQIWLDSPLGTPLRYDAEAAGGPVAADAFPTLVEVSSGRTRWIGTTGAGTGPGASVQLRTDAGSIQVNPQP